MSEPSPDIHSLSNNDPMPYGVLGDDQTTSLEKLEKYSGIVEWSYLKPHYKNEALIFVDLSLSITEVGEALANDDADRVSLWRSTGDIITPSAPHASYWEESQTKFKALVVSPFVLIQPIQSP